MHLSLEILGSEIAFKLLHLHEVKTWLQKETRKIQTKRESNDTQGLVMCEMQEHFSRVQLEVEKHIF